MNSTDYTEVHGITLPTGLYINGVHTPAHTGGTFAITNPATGHTLAHLADATSTDALAALTSAHTAQESWARTTTRHRAEILREAYERTVAHAEELATLITLEMGKNLTEAHAEVRYGAEYLRWFSEEAPRHYGNTLPTPEGTHLITTIHKPVGPALLLTPWNFPLAMATRKLAPAIAAGCTSILKPAEHTPLTLQYFTHLIADLLPAGVLNTLPTSTPAEISTPLLADERLRKISFTGSTRVGKQLAAAATQHLQRTSLELGGNAPFIIFEDANLEEALAGAAAAKLRNIGQACTAANRFIVHESIAEEFAQRLAELFNTQRMGNGLEPDTDIGPLITLQARERIHALVTDAIAQGATLLTGGYIPETPELQNGAYYPATVLANVTPEMDIARTEIFGPVAPILTFATETQAYALANNTEYGLASYVYTQDTARALRAAGQLHYGMAGLNMGVISNAAAPFGGIKSSGLGREGGAEGIEEYSETQYITLPNPHTAIA